MNFYLHQIKLLVLFSILVTTVVDFITAELVEVKKKLLHAPLLKTVLNKASYVVPCVGQSLKHSVSRRQNTRTVVIAIIFLDSVNWRIYYITLRWKMCLRSSRAGGLSGHVCTC